MRIRVTESSDLFGNYILTVHHPAANIVVSHQDETMTWATCNKMVFQKTQSIMREIPKCLDPFKTTVKQNQAVKEISSKATGLAYPKWKELQDLCSKMFFLIHDNKAVVKDPGGWENKLDWISEFTAWSLSEAISSSRIARI